jgi:DME family drug/metabolite transporter
MSRSVVFVLLAGVLLGTAGTAAALGPDAATPLGVGGMRLVGGALVLVVLLPRLGGSRGNLPELLRRGRVWVMAAGAGFYQPCFFGAVDRSGVAVATLVAVGSAPVFTGLLGWAVLRHRPTAAWVGATVLAIVGLLLLSWGDLDLDDGVGLVLALGAGLCSSCYVVAAKGELDRGGNVVELPTAAYLLGSVLLAPLVVTEPLGWVASPSGLALVVYLGVVTMAIANVLLVRGMRGLPPGPTATLTLADPLTATVLGLVVLGEVLPPLGFAGIAVLLVALVLQARALRIADDLDAQPVI